MPALWLGARRQSFRSASHNWQIPIKCRHCQNPVQSCVDRDHLPPLHPTGHLTAQTQAPNGHRQDQARVRRQCVRHQSIDRNSFAIDRRSHNYWRSPLKRGIWRQRLQRILDQGQSLDYIGPAQRGRFFRRRRVYTAPCRANRRHRPQCCLCRRHRAFGVLNWPRLLPQAGRQRWSLFRSAPQKYHRPCGRMFATIFESRCRRQSVLP